MLFLRGISHIFGVPNFIISDLLHAFSSNTLPLLLSDVQTGFLIVVCSIFRVFAVKNISIMNNISYELHKNLKSLDFSSEISY